MRGHAFDHKDTVVGISLENISVGDKLAKIPWLGPPIAAHEAGDHPYRRRLQRKPRAWWIRRGAGVREAPDGAVRGLSTDDE